MKLYKYIFLQIFKSIFILFLLLCGAEAKNIKNSATVFMYHKFGVSKYPSTSVTLDQLNMLPKDSIVMHPFPRVTEIPKSFDQDKRAKYFDQIKFGVWCRQILLQKVLL